MVDKAWQPFSLFSQPGGLDVLPDVLNALGVKPGELIVTNSNADENGLLVQGCCYTDCTPPLHQD